MTTIIEAIDGDYVTLQGRDDGPRLADFMAAGHQPPIVGQRLEVVWEKERNSFGSHFYGFVPEGYDPGDKYTRDEPND